MTEAGWTRGKDVKVEGWYWWEVEEETGLSLKVVQVEKGFTWIESEGRDVLYVVGYGGLLENKPGRFKGPLTPDSFQQGRVAAFKEAEQRFDSMFGATDRRIDSVRDYRVDKFYTWLAQQAQGGVGGGWQVMTT